MKRLVIAILLAVALLVIPVSVALAATTADVTVYATPSYVSISIAPTSWTINDVAGGGGLLDINTTYYSNDLGDTTAFSDPVTDAECHHALTNDSTVNINLKADMTDFTGGTDPMTNGNGTAGANAFAAWVCESGANWSAKVIMDTSGSTVFWTSSSAGDDIEVAFAVQTQTGDWTGGGQQTSTITLTATSS
jgi:hypothetical protein